MTPLKNTMALINDKQFYLFFAVKKGKEVLIRLIMENFLGSHHQKLGKTTTFAKLINSANL